MPDDRAQKALTEARHTIAKVDNPRLETVREQLSEILFGDDGHSVAQCLSTLRVRQEIERLLIERIQSAPMGQNFALMFESADVDDLWGSIGRGLRGQP